MQSELILLRILHILPGAIWVGTAVFLAVILEPALRKAGPDVARGIGPHLVDRVFALAVSSALITILMGLALVQRTPGRDFGQLFSNDWGWLMGVGLISSVIALVLGVTSNRALKQIVAISKSLLPGPPGTEEAEKIAQLQKRSRILGRAVALLVLLAVALMASARLA
jgi:uncharacterized membrane protein